MYVSINGRLLHKDDAVISVFDRGFLYGDGVFETIPVFNGEILWFNEHMSRLIQGCKLLEISIPWDSDSVLLYSQEVLQANKINEHVKLKIIVSRGTSSDPANIERTDTCTPNLIIYCAKNILPTSQIQHGIKLLTIVHNRPYPEIKSLSYISSIMGQIHSRSQAFDDALFLSHENYILEGTGFNFFALSGNTAITPIEDVLQGITASKVIDLLNRFGIEVIRQPIAYSDLPKMSEVFITGTTKSIVPVVQVDDIMIGDGQPGNTTKTLIEEYNTSRV